MGVRGLQTFLENNCPDACYTVELAKLVEEYQLKTGRQAEIVVDSQSCYSLWCREIDWMVGYEMQEFIYRLKSFVESFTKIGAKLVFFFGSITPKKKRDAWITRRLRNIRDVLRTYDLIRENNDLKQLPEYYNSVMPNMGIMTSHILKYLLHCTVYYSVDECDEEIIEYVSKNNSFGIFAQDTDFIISDLDAVVLSSKNFNMNKMTTQIYDRAKLCQHLDIKIDELPLLAILAGNDLVPYQQIRDFHMRLLAIKYVEFGELMPKLGKYIRHLREMSNDEKLETIDNALFSDTSNLELIKVAYSSYMIHCVKVVVEPVDEWTRILKKALYRHRNTIFPSLIWPILHDQIFECAVAFEDLRKINDKNTNTFEMASATITRPLRQRLYGVLLHQHNNEDITVAEWCGENEDSYRKPVIVKPVPPTVHHPGLLLLWSDDIGERVCRYRFTLFVNAVAPTILDSGLYRPLVEDELIATLVMYHLYNECQCLSKAELHAMIATFVTFPLFSREKLADLSYGSLSFRAARLSVLYIRTFGFVISLLASCGFPVPLSENVVKMKFEGKLYQIKYHQAVKDRKKYNDLCENDTEILKKFYRMKNLIYDFRAHPNNDEKQDKKAYKTRPNERPPRPQRYRV